MTPMTKSSEDTARRIASRRGWILTKSRRRDPLATDYGHFFLTNIENSDRQFEFDNLDQVQAFLDDPANWS